MAFLTPLAAELGGWTFRKILPWGLLLLASAGFAIVLIILSARLDMAYAALQSARHDDEIAKADAQRWAASAGRMQRVIDDQAAQLARQAADLVAAQRIADATVKREAEQVSDMTSQLQSLKARANAHPSDVRLLGPIVADVLIGLRRQADGGAAATPAAN